MMQMSDNEILQKAYDLGFNYENDHGACAQCVLAACFDLFDDWHEDVFKASYALSGGGGLTIEGTCGALAGGFLAISLWFGRSREEFDQGHKLRCLELAKELHDRFVAEYGSSICRDVQVKLMDKAICKWCLEDQELYEETDGLKKICSEVVGNTAKWTADIILRERPTSDGP